MRATVKDDSRMDTSNNLTSDSHEPEVALHNQDDWKASENVNSFPYESADFFQCWWSTLAPRFDIPLKNRDLLVFRKKLAKGFFSFRELRIAGWNAAWNQDLTEARLAELQELKVSAKWDYFRYSWSDYRQEQQALDQLRASGLPFIQLPGRTEHSIDLSQGFDPYLKSLSHNGRKALKKKVRRAESLCPQRVRLTDASDIDAFFKEFIPLHQAYWDQKSPGGSYLHIKEEQDFIIEWSRILHHRGQLVLDKILLDGETVNLSMGIQVEDTFYWLFTLNTGLHSDYGPGLIGLYLRAKEMAEDGIRLFKMGAGDYFYKVQSANCSQQCHDIIVANPNSLRGKLYLAWVKRNATRQSRQTPET